MINKQQETVKLYFKEIIKTQYGCCENIWLNFSDYVFVISLLLCLVDVIFVC